MLPDIGKLVASTDPRTSFYSLSPTSYVLSYLVISRFSFYLVNAMDYICAFTLRSIYQLIRQVYVSTNLVGP